MEELDLKAILNIIWAKMGYVFLITIIIGVIGFVYSYFLVTPVYQAATTLVLVQSEDTKTSDSTQSITQTDLTLNQKLVSTYRELIKSKNIIRQVIDNLKIDMGEEELRKNITVSSFKDTELIEIKVKHQDPKMSTRIANEIVTVFGKEVVKIFNINNVSIVDTAEVPTVPANINHPRTVVIFSGIGFILSIIIFILVDIFDTTIKSREMVEEVFDLPVLATIPFYEGEKNAGGKMK